MDLLAALRRQPFEPFRVVTTDGTTYRIDHSDRVRVTLSSAIIGYPDERQPEVIARYHVVSLRHVIRLEARQ